MSLEKVLDDKISHLLMKIDKQKLPKHVAIIMDGNGRFRQRGFANAWYPCIAQSSTCQHYRGR